MTANPDHYAFAYTGASNSRIHLAEIEEYQTRSICGTGVGGTVEYRPSRWQLDTHLCPKCKREAKRLGIDPYTLGYREAVDD